MMSNRNVDLYLDALSDWCKSALDGAYRLCEAEGNCSVDIEHWILAMLQMKGGGANRILKRQGMPAAELRGALQEALNFRFPIPAFGPLALSERMCLLLESAWLRAHSTENPPVIILSAHVLMAIAEAPQLQSVLWRDTLGALSSSAIERMISSVCESTQESSSMRIRRKDRHSQSMQ